MKSDLQIQIGALEQKLVYVLHSNNEWLTVNGLWQDICKIFFNHGGMKLIRNCVFAISYYTDNT